MAELYPLKFEPIIKEKVWGGHTLAARYHKDETGSDNIGESWEISAVANNLSIVKNGFLAGNNIEELIEVYMGDITGDAVFERFGNEFPLLIKFIEAREDLSIQVHPGNDTARKRHNAYGKTEMWYILESEKDAKIYSGFKENVTKEVYESSLKNGNIADILNVEVMEPGDALFTPAGRIHAIGAGIVLVEIQQTSDITYRISDWNRVPNGKVTRELHNDLAIDVIDFSEAGKCKIRIDPDMNQTETLVTGEFFTTNLLVFNTAIDKQYFSLDSFVIYICVEGEFVMRWEDNTETVTKGETILLPAMIKEVTLETSGEARVLEIFIENENNI